MDTQKNLCWNLFGVCLFLCAAQAGAQSPTRIEVMEVEGRVERASGPSDLQQIDSAGRITVRALHGFGRLPERFVKFALEARGSGIDLLGAGPDDIRELLGRAESGALAIDPQPLRELLALLENRDYLTWEALQPGAELNVDESDLFRGDGRALLHLESGPTITLAPGGRVEQASGLIAAADTAAAGTSGATAAISPPITQQTDSSIVLPKTWAPAPGMRLFDRQLPDQDTASDESPLASIAATLDGGYVVAGSVQGSGGQEVWITRYDQNDRLLWSRVLGGNFNLQTQGVGLIEDGGLLIAGNLADSPTGVLIALDAEGALRWSRVTGNVTGDATDQAGKADHLAALATAEDGSALAVGQVGNTSANPAALAMSVRADGEIAWRLDLPEARIAHAALADGDGWLIAGEAHSPAHGAWLARLDRQGKLVWQRAYGAEDGGAAMALARLPQGDIVIAGRDGKNAEVWLRRLDTNGDLTGEQRLALNIEGQPVVQTLLGMAPDAEGGYWLGGATRTGDGWLARIDDTGQPRWVRAYGREGPDALKGLLARPAGALAVGASQSDDRQGARSLWMLAVDGDGAPVAAPALSDKARELGVTLAEDLSAADSSLRLGGSPEINEAPDGAIRILLPFARLEEELPFAAEVREIDLGQLRIDISPIPEQGLWRYALDWPASLSLRDASGNELGVFEVSEHKAEMDWLEARETPIRLDFMLKDMAFRLDGKPRLATLYTALAIPDGSASLPPDPDRTERMTLDRLQLDLKMATNPDNRWSGAFSFELAGWHDRTRSGFDAGRLGGMRIGVDYQDMDLDRIDSASDTLVALLSGDDSQGQQGATPQQVVVQLLEATGSAKTEFVLTDLAIDASDGSETLHLAELRSAASGVPSPASRLLRDIAVSYSVKGLAIKDQETDNQIGALDLTLNIERLALANLFDHFFSLAMGAEPTPDRLSALMTESLKGAEMSVSGSELHIASPANPPANIDSFGLTAALRDADTPNANLALRYEHQGVTGLPDVPPEVLPGSTLIDLGLSNVPAGPLFGATLQDEVDPQELLMLFAQHATRLDIHAIDLEMPIARMGISGIALTESATAADSSPILRATTDIEVQHFDALIDWIATTMESDEDRRQLRAAAALMKLAGNEEKRDDGAIVHRFAVIGTSDGELTVNGKDIQPLMDLLQ